MANRPQGYGLTAELAKKNAAKFVPDEANDMLDWIRDVFEEGNVNIDLIAQLDVYIETPEDLQELLKSGIILCELVNVIKPGTIKKINKSKLAFNQMENIGKFLSACETMGCKKLDLFQTVDLYEANNLIQVINGICALGRKAPTYFDGPRLGPEEHTENKRTFTDLQMRAGEGVIRLQSGSNKGSSQSGQNFGKTRAILD